MRAAGVPNFRAAVVAAGSSYVRASRCTWRAACRGQWCIASEAELTFRLKAVFRSAAAPVCNLEMRRIEASAVQRGGVVTVGSGPGRVSFLLFRVRVLDSASCRWRRCMLHFNAPVAMAQGKRRGYFMHTAGAPHVREAVVAAGTLHIRAGVCGWRAAEAIEY